MKQRIAQIAIVVKDYDEAIEFYCKKLNFSLVEDTILTPEKRWVIVQPPGSNGCGLLLAKAANKEQELSIGNQTGGRVFMFLFTDDFDRDYTNMLNNNIEFVRPPEEHAYGKVAVFKDLYGNLWDFIEPNEKNSLF